MSERDMKKQLGISLIGLILVLVVIMTTALLAIKVFPDVQEYFAIVRSVKSTAADAAGKGASVAQIQVNFDRRRSIDNITAISGSDLDVSKEGNDIIIAFSYTKKIPLYGPVSLTIDFEGSSAQ